MKALIPNRLIHEKSPYLLQHAYNPVLWFPWGSDAFTKAKSENKPVFLSIGYSTCHWCHVMAHESFEDEDTAKLLNEFFVPVKVDREERPDIDSIYMGFVTATTGGGGWPMTVFLTPEQKPFYGGTYFPPESRWGSPGFKDLLWSVHQSWTKQESQARGSGDSFVEAFSRQLKQKAPSGKILSVETLAAAYSQLEQSFDPLNGGFGHSPKFPMGHNLSFLLRFWKNAKEPKALEMVEKTLSVMAQSGINDQLGGGFHRYSTDTFWQVPHFEKMLYDQALLVKIYTEAFLATGNKSYALTASETLEYVLRDMSDPLGGFYSAEDADSLTAFDNTAANPANEDQHKKLEGAYYVWTISQLTDLLSPEELALVKAHYGIQPQGNAVFDPHGEFAGKNILHAKFPADNPEILSFAKKKLLASRATRPRPHRDDKILTDWNALMISAFALAGRAFQDDRYLRAAKKAASFILENLQRPDGRLLHRYCDGEAAILAGLEDYAFFAAAFLDLYENTLEAEYLERAVSLTRAMIALFDDEERGGFYLTAKDGEELIYRPKEVYDGAVPSGNSVAALNLLRIYFLTGDDLFLKKAEAVFKFFLVDVTAHPAGYCQMMMAVQFLVGPVREITIEGDITSGDGKGMLEEVFKIWDPQRILKVLPAGPGALPVARVCSDRVCHPPVKSREDLKRFLE